MARKRLSDLLREEGQKAADQDTSEAAKPNQALSAKSARSTDDATDNGSDAEAIPVTAEVIASQAEQVGDFVAELRDASAEPDDQTDGAEASRSESDNSESDNSQADRSNPSVPELTALEATITQLNADLEMAQQAAQTAQFQQTALQEKISSLEAKVSAQAEVIQQLQAEKQQGEQQAQQQVEQLKAELESAKTMILQLSQANAKPNTKPTAKPLPSSRVAEPELESTNAQIVVPSVKSAQPKQPIAAERPKLHQLELRKMLDHPTRPGSLPPMPSETKPAEKEIKLSDTDVGWMD